MIRKKIEYKTKQEFAVMYMLSFNSDHVFDSEARARTKERAKTNTISTDRNAIQKGALGVRWEKARCNQSKLLPSVKMGIHSPTSDK